MTSTELGPYTLLRFGHLVILVDEQCRPIRVDQVASEELMEDGRTSAAEIRSAA